MQTIALPISLGLSQRRVAETLGLSRRVVGQRYEALKWRLWQISQQTDGEPDDTAAAGQEPA